MKPLPVTAVSCQELVSTDPPQDLRTLLRAAVPNAPRRLNRLIELALIGAHRCVAGRALAADTAIYTALTSGCIGDSVQLVGNVAHGRPVMPVTFINISSNMAGFYVSSSLGLHSANHVVACNDFPWEAALELAMLGGTSALLLGAVEECAWPLAEHRARLHLPPDAALLETSHWLLSDRTDPSPRAVIADVRRLEDAAAVNEWLAPLRGAANTRLRIQGAGADEAAALVRAANLPVWGGGEGEGYCGMPVALACCRFIDREPGSLVHLSRGAAGAWYALRIEKKA